MPTIAIGDVHGSLPALRDLLSRLDSVAGAGDTVVFLGDYLDRGPDTKGCLEEILRFRGRTPARVVALRGNHEDWFLKTLRDPFRHSWLLGMEAFDTIRSYSPEAEAVLRAAAVEAGARLLTERLRLPYERFFESMPAAHLEFLESLPAFFRTSDTVCVHGGLDPSVAALEAQRTEDLIWGTDEFPDGYTGSEWIVYGHWNNAGLDENGWPHPRIAGKTIGVDTIAHGVLTAAILPGPVILQSGRFSRLT